MANIEVARAAYIQLLNSRVDFAFATDSASINGNTRRVTKVIHRVIAQLPHSPHVGLEMLAWSHQLIPELLFGRIRQHFNKIPLIGFHSMLGTVPKFARDTIVTSVSDALLVDPQTLADLASQYSIPPYILIHNVFARSVPPESLYMHKAFLAIENAANPGDYKEMLQQTKGKERVIPVFDIVHYLRDNRCLKKPTPQQWQNMCDALAACGPCIVHLPIGQQAYDSLDFDNITDAMWQRLAQTLNKHPTFIVVEYQPKSMLFGIKLENKQIDPLIHRINFLQQRNVLT